MIQFTLPWPPSALRPNASSPGAWRKKATAAALYKSLCAIELREQGIGKVNVERVHVTLRFRPPDRNRRDLDNALASIKVAIDSVSEAIGVDDRWFTYTLLRGEVVKGGRVDVMVTEGE